MEIALMASLRYNTFQKANNKGADQTARSLVCTFVVRKPSTTEDRFSHINAHI